MTKKPLIVFASDHAGFALKEVLKIKAEDWGFPVKDCGTHSIEAVDYSDYITPVVSEVLKGAMGVLVCGSGIGMSIGANRFKGIHAALCCDSTMAKMSRSHNNANILVLGERFIEKEEALSCLEMFLDTPFEGGRHTRRIEKLDQLTVN